MGIRLSHKLESYCYTSEKSGSFYFQKNIWCQHWSCVQRISNTEVFRHLFVSNRKLFQAFLLTYSPNCSQWLIKFIHIIIEIPNLPTYFLPERILDVFKISGSKIFQSNRVLLRLCVAVEKLFILLYKCGNLDKTSSIIVHLQNLCIVNAIDKHVNAMLNSCLTFNCFTILNWTKSILN